MTPIRGLLLDLDGVIRHWRGHGATRGEQAAGLPAGTINALAYGEDFDLAHYGILTHAHWIDAVRRRLTGQHGPRATAAITPWADDRGEVDPNMVDLLTAARRASLPIGLLTNNTDAVRADLTHFGIAGLFDAVVCSADVGLVKPAPLIYRIAADAIGLAPEEIFFTDDRAENITGARHVGMRAELFTGPSGYRTHLVALGLFLPEPAALRPEAYGSDLRCALAGLGAVTAPSAHAAEHTAQPGLLVRYLAGETSPPVVARALSAHPAVRHAMATERAIGGILASGELFEIRHVTDAASLPVHAQDPAAWVAPDAPNPPDPDVEYLPPWTTSTLTRAATDAGRALDRTGWSLSQAVLAHTYGDRLGAALALDRARAELAYLATGLARHDTSAGAAVCTTRYLDRATSTALTRSMHPDPTTPEGLAVAVTELVRLLPWVRYHVAHVLHTDPRWPFEHLADLLTPLLGTRPDLSPQPPHDAALYDEHLADHYDTARPVPTAMAAALHRWARDELTGADVVELGAGTGRITTHLAAPAGTYHAVEFSPAMHRRLVERLTQHPVPSVQAHLADAMCLPLPDASVDTVVEHETLLFTPHPPHAVDEALRVLRPHGRLVRLLVHSDGATPDPVECVHRAFRSALRRHGVLPLIRGKGTDHLVTAHLHALGMPTTEGILARWTEHLTVRQVLAPLESDTLPFTRHLPDEAREAGLQDARAAAQRLSGPEGVIFAARRLYALTTTRPQT